MLTLLPQNFSIEPIADQVSSLGSFKRIELNEPTGEFFNDCWTVKKEFLDTPLGKVLDSLGQIGQARLLCLESGETYTAHSDPDDRIHLPIITNEYSYLIDITNNKMYHIPSDGKLWHMDTSLVHVAVNWGPRSRIHLNVRKLLPKYNKENPGLKIKVLEGEFDWKQLAYTPIMGAINKYIKDKIVTGFKGINEKEVLINTDNPSIFDPIFNKIRKTNVVLKIDYV